MKVVYIGCVNFSFQALRHIASLDLAGLEIAGIITKKSSKFNADYCSLEPIANDLNIPFIFADQSNQKELYSWINGLTPDIIFCFGWSSLLSKQILNIPNKGVLGYHPAELPKNRGRHPIIWALALGLKQTASTFFFMDEGADSGDILDQVIIPINKEDDASSLYQKIIYTALDQITCFLPMLINDSYQLKPQDHSKANYWRKRFIKDGEIDWRMSAKSIHNLVRALTRPYPGAHCFYKNDEVKVWKTEIVYDNLLNMEPGKVLNSEEGTLIIKCGKDSINLIDHDFRLIPKKGEYL